MASRGASSRWNSCKFVVSSIRENRELFLANLGRTLQEPLPEERQIPDIGEFIDVLADGLEARGEMMVSADLANLDELGGDTKHRVARDDNQEVLTDKYRRRRDIFTGAFGEPAARDVGFEPAVERDPKRLELQIRRVKERLQSPEFELPEILASGLLFDRTAFAESFEPEYGRLIEANKSVLREVRRADTSLIAKKKAIEVYDRWFLWAAGTWESLLKLAGMFEEAERVRPSLRRPGRRAQDAESDRQEPEGSGDRPSNETSPDAPAPDAPPEGSSPDAPTGGTSPDAPPDRDPDAPAAPSPGSSG